MTSYTYKIVPAPERARKIRGVKTPEARFAATLEEDMNALAGDGWEFVRAETFTVEEKVGFTGRKSVERRVLVYRRALETPAVAEPVATFRAAPEPVAEASEAAAKPGGGPRILGRPVPPVTRLRREGDSGGGAD